MKDIKKRFLIGFLVLVCVLLFSGCGEKAKSALNSIVVSETAKAVVEETMVWIPRWGEKYHSRADCSNMENPLEVTLSQAEVRGFERCKKCW